MFINHCFPPVSVLSHVFTDLLLIVMALKKNEMEFL